MKQVKIFKALANNTRLQILEWLKEPSRHFGSLISDCTISRADPKKVGVCVGFIQQKSGLSQSTISQFLCILLEAELVTASRVGQWTYYKRNEKTISEIVKYINKKL